MRPVRVCERLLIGLFAATVILTGCIQEYNAGPVAKSSPPVRSAFYGQLSDPKSNTLKTRFENKFPAHTFQVQVLGPLKVTSPEGQVSHQVEVQVAVKNATPMYDADRPLILSECESYLRELLSSSGLELNGSVHETIKDEKKDGFWFYYKSSNHSGSVIVHPDIAGALVIVVREQE